MMKLPFLAVTISLVFFIVYFIPQTHALGSGSTLAVVYNSGTVCGIVAEQKTKNLICYRNGQTIFIEPNVSFSSISGGRNSFCGVRSGGYSLLCWDYDFSNSTFSRKRLYFSNTTLMENLSMGNGQICATLVNSKNVTCWRGGNNYINDVELHSYQFISISSGFDFSCGILIGNRLVRCWGSNNSIAKQIEDEFRNVSMLNLVAGGSHVCGLNVSGFLICKGNNDYGQLNYPLNLSMEFSELSLGESHSCGIIKSNQTVVCWGGKGTFSVNEIQGVRFELIVSGSNFSCGLTSSNLSVICWGPGWTNNRSEILSLPAILPGPCVRSLCSECGIYLLSQTLCSDSEYICKRCLTPILVPPPPPVPASESPAIGPASSPSRALKSGLLAFAVVGSVGGFAGICTVIYWLWIGVCLGNKKIHNSVQPTITRAGSSNNRTTSNTNGNSPPSRSSTIRRQGSRIFGRQRSGTSSKHAEKAEEFSLAELANATNNFSLENKIGAGSFGVVYKGKLPDGREVAIKRGETSSKTKKFQEKESAFDSELAFLSRLHHKHLVRLVGYCEEKDERLLVYEYMKNGALYDHLHDKNNIEKSSSLLNSWKIRIKIALDAARGIEYLHNYAVPPIIHRDIKSSNILLDAYWTARVSDFGLSLMGPESDGDYTPRPTKAAGTVGYIDPEYYGLNVLTAKSDVYGLGVVLLELLTGKRAIFKNGENGGTPTSIVDYAVPSIMVGELVKILDPRVGSPELNEAEAVELVGYTATHCVNLEGKERPTMADIVANLERALTLCNDSHGSISSGSISIVSD